MVLQLLAAAAIAASGACDANWPSFMSNLAGLPSGRSLRVLDHRGLPMSGISVNVSVNGGPPQNVALSPGMDGDTGVTVPDGGTATVSVAAWPHAIVAGADADTGSFQTPLTLPAGCWAVCCSKAGDCCPHDRIRRSY